MNEPSDSASVGTSWRIWDLHVHTPASLVQGYGGNTDEVWSHFLDDLERLPEEIAVVGINDYWFLDGYRRVVEAKAAGRLANLEAIFPVIEMRLDQFGGTDGKLARVNLHVIFDPDLGPDLIEAQFINALQPKLQLSPQHQGLSWQGVITRDSLTDLGKKIKESVPAEHLPNYGSDLQEGFNNLNVSLGDVKDVLAGDYFRSHALVGIGKTEWNDVKWADGSIAAKKNVINSADFVFTAYEDVARWEGDVASLRAANVTYRLLDCSDAHHFSDSDQQMRLGACQTWMNTTASLAGLAYAIEEFERRVYVGLEPPALARKRTNPERFISRVKVNSDNPTNVLFDHDLLLNTGFVAIVGNKGQGKSALLDCIALGGNSSRNDEFAFLRPSRFLSPANIRVAREYQVEVDWANGASRSIRLTDGHDSAAPVSVEYLPQAFVERVCNSDPSSPDADEFERELRTVLFTHISDEHRAGEASFDALLAQKTRVSQEAIARLREELRSAIARYVTIASFRAANDETSVQSRIELRNADLVVARQALVDEQSTLRGMDAQSGANERLEELKHVAEQIEETRARLLADRGVNEQGQAQLRQELSTMGALESRVANLRSDATAINDEAAVLLGNDAEPFVTVFVNDPQLIAWRSTVEAALSESEAAHAVLEEQIALQERSRRENAEGLAAADSARERARQRVLQAEERVSLLFGDENDEESLAGLEALLARVREAPGDMSARRNELLVCAKRIHEALSAQLQAVRSLYEPASTFIADSEVVRSAGLEFSAELRVLSSWSSVAAGLDGRRNGDYSEWLAELPQRLEDTSWTQLAAQLEEAILRLERERGSVNGEFRNPADALRTATTLSEFLTSMLDLAWLEVRFGLTGDGLPLTQLSPGQRGLVLALFYLVVDLRATPLLLDQPEENLDNETIASRLVPAIHQASGRRQTIVVTHNANLAVVGDADQIIHCRQEDGRFSVHGGSIAELDVARFALDILEGTKPAFDNRRHKYEAFPELA